MSLNLIFPSIAGIVAFLVAYQKVGSSPVLLVSPHKCLHPRPPHCDVASAEMAEKLKEYLQSIGVSVELLVSDKYRHKCDPNRASCHDDELRQKIRRFMQEFPNARIIEVHSFPYSTFEDQWRDVPVSQRESTFAVVLNIRGSAFESAITKAVGAYPLQGDRVVNDIGFEATRREWDHVLLELRYDTLNNPSEWEKIKKGLGDYVSSP